MRTDTKEDVDTMVLAVTAEEHLRETGHDVKVTPVAGAASFEVVPNSGGRPFCRVQPIGSDAWEMAILGGDTLTGVGTREIFLTMLERVVTNCERKAA